MQQVTIDIGPDGRSVKIETKGFVGRACMAAVKTLKAALGVVTSETPTGEMHLRESQNVRQQS